MFGVYGAQLYGTSVETVEGLRRDSIAQSIGKVNVQHCIILALQSLNILVKMFLHLFH